MNEAQVWTSIGVLGTGLFAMLTLMSTMFVRIVQTEIGSVRTEIGSLRSQITSEFSAVRTEVQRVEDVMTTRFTHLDRDVQAIARKVFGDDAA